MSKSQDTITAAKRRESAIMALELHLIQSIKPVKSLLHTRIEQGLFAFAIAGCAVLTGMVWAGVLF